jgi:hypothetical protein
MHLFTWSICKNRAQLKIQSTLQRLSVLSYKRPISFRLRFLHFGGNKNQPYTTKKQCHLTYLPISAQGQCTHFLLKVHIWIIFDSAHCLTLDAHDSLLANVHWPMYVAGRVAHITTKRTEHSIVLKRVTAFCYNICNSAGCVYIGKQWVVCTEC